MSVRNHLCGLWDLVPISLLSAAQGCGGQVKAPATPACASAWPLEVLGEAIKVLSTAPSSPFHRSVLF